MSDLIKKSGRNRNYTVDLLRIFSMLMVVILHATLYGMENTEITPLSSLWMVQEILRIFSIVAVNVFVLISGYYLSGKATDITKPSIKNNYKRLFPLWIQVEMYSVCIYLVLTLLPIFDISFSVKRLIYQACPLLTNQYWFFTGTY